MNYDLWILKELYLVWVGDWDSIYALHKRILRAVAVWFSYAMKIVLINVVDIRCVTWLYCFFDLFMFYLVG